MIVSMASNNSSRQRNALPKAVQGRGMGRVNSPAHQVSKASPNLVAEPWSRPTNNLQAISRV